VISVPFGDHDGAHVALASVHASSTTPSARPAELINENDVGPLQPVPPGQFPGVVPSLSRIAIAPSRPGDAARADDANAIIAHSAAAAIRTAGMTIPKACDSRESADGAPKPIIALARRGM
jgi:hypothetical protein